MSTTDNASEVVPASAQGRQTGEFCAQGDVPTPPVEAVSTVPPTLPVSSQVVQDGVANMATVTAEPFSNVATAPTVPSEPPSRPRIPVVAFEAFSARPDVSTPGQPATGPDFSSSDSDDCVSGRLLLEDDPGWTVTRTFQYLVHPVQSSKDFLGVVLKGLKVKRVRGSDWLDMEPEAGQCVVVGDRRFTLVLCMQIGRGYRVWVTGDEGCFTAQAKDVVDVFPLTGSDKTTALQRRLEVLTFFIVVPHAYTYILCCRCSKEQRRCRRVTCLRGEDTRTPASANPVF